MAERIVPDDECPNCGKYIGDLWDCLEDDRDTAEWECPHCEAQLVVERVIYYTLRMKEGS